MLSPGTTIFPSSPPARTPERVSSRRLCLARCAPWQRTQEAFKIGAMSLSNVRSFLSDAAGSLLTSTLLMSQGFSWLGWAVTERPASNTPHAVIKKADFILITADYRKMSRDGKRKFG